jgi:8-oxo-dGTP pyrophosphatase MutT (NUDIX family)
MNKIINNNLCNNCGKQGHSFHNCKLPITSYGIIVFRQSIHGLQYLMIRRKDSFGYIDFIRGKYSPYNIYQVQNIVNEMSQIEKKSILTESFDNLWNTMWGDTNNNQYKNEEQTSSKKIDLIRDGISINDNNINLQNIVDKSSTQWVETEWEFPKGRRNYKEKDLECALREFEEETGISQTKITIVENVLPFEEIFIGTNHKSYKHKYFLANMSDDEEYLTNFQITEVSKLEWKTIDECLKSIRPYNLEKKKLITNINKVLQEYSLYS